MKKIALVLFLLLFTLVGCGKGKASFDDLKDIDSGTTTSKVIEYVGEPAEKTIDKDEIYDWGPASISKWSNLEMYVYKMNDGDKARLFFSNDKLIYKRPVGLNE
ncbi:hypothetical protein ABE940_11020 [Enterococcus avium]|uniref:hypothetical protein n=1 Tax=Enterococcus avium TaxID=33945 RepID=UPI003D6C542F